MDFVKRGLALTLNMGHVRDRRQLGDIPHGARRCGEHDV